MCLQVESLFQEAARLSPEDSDLHTVLGVLFNLSRNYDKAISSFERALQLKPRDYSLWNKLGATQANSSRSAEAIYAYQQVSQYFNHKLFEWVSYLLNCGCLQIEMITKGRMLIRNIVLLQALDLKPNYVRAWSNMGIGYANQVLFSVLLESSSSYGWMRAAILVHINR